MVPFEKALVTSYRPSVVTFPLRAISFQDIQPMWSWSTNITDKWTDDMWMQDRALHYSASHSNKTTMYSYLHITGNCQSHVQLYTNRTTTYIQTDTVTQTMSCQGNHCHQNSNCTCTA